MDTDKNRWGERPRELPWSNHEIHQTQKKDSLGRPASFPVVRVFCDSILPCRLHELVTNLHAFRLIANLKCLHYSRMTVAGLEQIGRG